MGDISHFYSNRIKRILDTPLMTWKDWIWNRRKETISIIRFSSMEWSWIIKHRK